MDDSIKQLELSITRAFQSTAGNYVTYYIQVAFKGCCWVINRRYKEFYELRQTLASLVPDTGRITFPEKVLNNSSEEVIEGRKTMLETYLQTLTLHEANINIRNALNDFLCIRDNFVIQTKLKKQIELTTLNDSIVLNLKSEQNDNEENNLTNDKVKEDIDKNESKQKDIEEK